MRGIPALIRATLSALSVFSFATLAAGPVSSLHAAAPAAPSDTFAIPTYNGARPILVQWTDNAGDETGFILQRSVDGGPFEDYIGLAANAVSYNDNSVKDLNKQYAYRVRAVNVDGDSDHSDPFGTAIGVTWPLGNGSHHACVEHDDQGALRHDH